MELRDLTRDLGALLQQKEARLLPAYSYGLNYSANPAAVNDEAEYLLSEHLALALSLALGSLSSRRLSHGWRTNIRCRGRRTPR